MRLIFNTFVAAAAVAFPAAAFAQTMTPQSMTPPTQTAPPDEPGQGPMQTAPTSTTQNSQTTTGITAATAADVKAGASVYDQSGGLVGKVDSMSASGVIVNTGSVRAQIPMSSFGKNDKGLVIGTTKADLDAAAKKGAKPK